MDGQNGKELLGSYRIVVSFLIYTLESVIMG